MHRTSGEVGSFVQEVRAKTSHVRSLLPEQTSFRVHRLRVHRHLFRGENDGVFAGLRCLLPFRRPINLLFGQLQELRQKLGHKLTLGDLLIKPVQRIMKYQLLLRDIAKYTQRADLKTEMEDLRVALQVMHVVPKSANDMMDVGRLQGFDVSL